MRTAYNRYYGNSGRMERVDDGQPANLDAGRRRAPHRQRPRPQSGPDGPDHGGRPEPEANVRPEPGPPPGPAPGPGPGIPPRPGNGGGGEGDLSRLLRRLSPARLDTEDLLLLATLYLLYRETGDRDFLWMLAGVAFL